MDSLPPGIDPIIWHVVRAAYEADAPVTLHLRADLTLGRPERAVTGRPVSFSLTSDGRVRVALAVAAGTEQYIVLERVERACLTAAAA